MTSIFHPLDPSGFPYHIRYVDLPRDAVSVRRHRIAVALRRVVVVAVAAGTLVAAGIGFASKSRLALGG